MDIGVQAFFLVTRSGFKHYSCLFVRQNIDVPVEIIVDLERRSSAGMVLRLEDVVEAVEFSYDVLSISILNVGIKSRNRCGLLEVGLGVGCLSQHFIIVRLQRNVSIRPEVTR